MTKTRNTKRALLMSALSLLLCVSMLVGTTFAWFTDSVSSGSNKIQAGLLSLDLELYDVESDTWNSIKESKKALFDYNLWEPGYTVVRLLKVENEGTLALKWKAKFISDDELSALAKVIDVYVRPYGMQADDSAVAFPAGRDLEGYENVGTLDSFVNTIEDTTYGSLKGGEAAYLGIALKMQESAGNTYQAMDLGGEFDIHIVATQYTYENDSFNDQYDGGAEYPIVPEPVEVDDSISFTDFAALVEEGGNIRLTEDVTIANPESSRFTRLNLTKDLGIYAEDGATLTFAETTTILGDATLTVYGGAIVEKQELCVAEDATLVFEGGEHSFNALSASGNGSIVVNGGVLNCNGSYAGIMGVTFGENGSLVMNGGRLNLYQPINLNQNRCDAAYVEINGGTVELLGGIENLFVVRNIMNKDREAGGVLRGSAVRVNGGTFIAHYEIDSAGDATSFIRNGDAPSDGNKVLVSAADGYDCVVTGGTFYGSWQRADNQRYTNGNGGYSDGQFVANSIAGFVAPGYQITGDATNGYIVAAN